MKHMGRLILLGTGGTIAGVAAQADDTEGYTPAALNVEQLLAAVPQAQTLQPIETEQLFQIGSEDMTPAHWCTLAQRTQHWLEQEEVAGVVITHGTDTLEESAWFLQCVLQTVKPVVLVGAMLPATAPDADGPANLSDALHVARCPQTHGRGVLVVMQGQIFSARDITKRFAGRIDAFTAGASEPLGQIKDNQVVFAVPARELHGAQFTLPSTLPSTLPTVEIVYGYATTSRVAVDALVQSGVRGIIYAAPGSGTLSITLRAALRDAAQRGVVVVRSSRTGAGRVRAHTHDADDARLFVSANTLNPQKARVLLMLALTQTHAVTEVQALFDRC